MSAELLIKKMTRRRFLRNMGIGAGSLLLPSCRYAYAAGAPPFRCLIFMEGNGTIARFFASDKTVATLNAAGGTIGSNDYELFNRKYGHSSILEIDNAGLSNAPALGSLAPQFQGDLSVEEDARVVLGLSSKVAGGGHSSNFGALTCSPSKVQIPSTASIDHILGAIPSVRGATPYDVVRLGIDSNSRSPFNYNTCSTGYQSPAPLICEPQVAYSNLFGSVASGESADAFINQRKLLDFMRADIDSTLAAFNGSPQMQYKLEKYGEAVETLSARHELILGLESNLRANAPDGPGVSPLYSSTRSLDHLEAMTDLTTAAFLGGLTNVAVVGSGTGGAFDLNYSRLGYGGIGRHDLCHANNYTALRDITDFHVQMVSKIAKSLKAVPEGSGTMLDNTVIIFMSDNGERHHSSADEWPMLVIGGSNLGFGPGNRTIAYPRVGTTSNRQVSNMFSTLTYAAGAGIENFGNDINRVSPGPLSELWSI